MKKITTSLLIGALCILSMNVSAFDGLNLNSLPNKSHSFTLKHHDTDTGDGIKGKIMITAGIGLNFEGSSLVVRYAISPYYNNSNFISGHQTMPMINAAVDYGFAKKFSAGIAFGYQTIIMDMNNVIVDGDSYHDTWTRLHFAARADYYIVAKDNINVYTGVKLGYNIFTVTTTLPPAVYPDYIHNLGVYPNPVSVQAHIGFSYFVKGIVGVNAEFGLGYGGPYVFAVGATVKI